MNCNNIKLTKGSKGTSVSEAQTILKKLGFYNGKIDGDYGELTVTSVKNFQKKYNLTVDGWIGKVTCQKLNSLNTPTQESYYKNGVYYSGTHYTSQGCDKLGQCTGYFCADCSMKQGFRKRNITKYSQKKLASYAGTTTAGTSHQGIETAIAKVAKLEGKTIKVTWKNFSDLGKSVNNRFEELGKLISKQNIAIILHTMYRNQYGHYETIKEVNMNNKTVTVLNSLGTKCNSPAYCGYLEKRSFNTMQQYLKGISQKSVCIIEF